MKVASRVRPGHAFGAALDNPGLIVACVIGDGEAETGPLGPRGIPTSFSTPLLDGAVLPILHLNGYKISNPTVLARIEPEELEQLLRGYGWTPYFVEGDEPERGCINSWPCTLDRAIEEILAHPEQRPEQQRCHAAALAHDRP